MSLIKKPNKPEIRERTSDILKFQTKNERDTDPAEYTERRPLKISENFLEQKILNHKKNCCKGVQAVRRVSFRKNKHMTIAFFSSAISCISTASNVAQALKMRIPKRNSKNDDVFIHRPDLTQVLHFSPDQSIAAHPTKLTTSAPSAPQLTQMLPEEKQTLQKNGTSDSESSSKEDTGKLNEPPKRNGCTKIFNQLTAIHLI